MVQKELGAVYKKYEKDPDKEALQSFPGNNYTGYDIKLALELSNSMNIDIQRSGYITPCDTCRHRLSPALVYGKFVGEPETSEYAISSLSVDGTAAPAISTTRVIASKRK